MPSLSSPLFAIITLFGAIDAVALPSGYHGGGPAATIDVGVVIGTTTSLPAATATIHKFLGIPFAKSPPVRFAPPESPGPFSDPIQATKYSPACIQEFVYPKKAQELNELVFSTPRPSENEDCLYLNVYAPSTPAPADGRAVMYWIYGGGFAYGNAGQPMYDGSWFAAYEDVIVVSVNYRTNVFGFPNSPELPLTGQNLGFLDQRFGLDWVQRNIAAFGGSPEKVTIFGESAGAQSVDALLTSFPAGSTPPFRGAILESGQVSYGSGSKFAYNVSSWEDLSKALGCPGNYTSDLACVRAASADEIRSIMDVKRLSFQPVPDKVTLVSNASERRAAGQIANIPCMGGTNAQEGRVFAIGQNNTAAYLRSTLGTKATPSVIQTIESLYPLGSPGIATPSDQIAQIITDSTFTCPQALWANVSAAVGIPTWRYYFNASFVNTQPLLELGINLGVFHSSEIPIVFSTYSPVNATTQEYALSNAMRGAWAAFAKNPLGGPGWNQVGSGGAGPVLFGDTLVDGGIYKSVQGKVLPGAWDLGLWGNTAEAMGSGITVIGQIEADYRCPILAEIFLRATNGDD